MGNFELIIIKVQVNAIEFFMNNSNFIEKRFPKVYRRNLIFIKKKIQNL